MGIRWGNRAYTTEPFQETELRRRCVSLEHTGAEVSLALIEQIWEDSGPFDGIMGFSQGAMLAAVVAAKGVLDPDYKAKPKFAIIYSAAYPLPFKGLLEKLRAGGHAVPSLHVLGRQDSTNPPELGQKLAACFADAQVMWHEGAHTVPDDPYIIAATHQFCTRAVSTPPQDGEMRE
jgi:dienelactone hydrolase